MKYLYNKIECMVVKLVTVAEWWWWWAGGDGGGGDELSLLSPSVISLLVLAHTLLLIYWHLWCKHYWVWPHVSKNKERNKGGWWVNGGYGRAAPSGKQTSPGATAAIFHSV